MVGMMLDNVRKQNPRVHCIANYVTANDCANLLLAVGASPIMADDPLESAGVTACCDVLTVSLGTLSERKLEAIMLSVAEAARKGIPAVLDPVGVTASKLRREAAMRLLADGSVSVIRGNAAEIRMLAGENVAACGLDAARGLNACVAARRLAAKTGAVVVVTGETDMVTDGMRLTRISNGHEILRSITGAGCQLTALLGAFAGANQEHIFDASVAAVCMMGLCGELAAGRMTEMDGSGSCRSYVIDAAYCMSGEKLREGAKYEA